MVNYLVFSVYNIFYIHRQENNKKRYGFISLFIIKKFYYQKIFDNNT